MNGIHEFITKNIKRRIDIIFEAYEVLENAKRVGGQFHAFKEYLEANLNNDGKFYLNAISIFISKVSSMNDDKRKRNIFPLNTR